MKKLELLGGVIEQFQISPQEVVESFVNQKKLDSNFLEDMAKKAKSFEEVTFIPSKKYVTPKDVQAGMFEYQSGLIYPKLIPNEPLRGIVGYADDNEILVWCLESAKLCWSEGFWEAGTRDKKLRGWEATQKVLETAKNLGKTAPAAEWCVDYAEDGVERGSAFLPSYVDYWLLEPNLKAVQRTFSKIGLDFGAYLWSSSEYSTTGACVQCNGGGASYGGLLYFSKYNNYDVRPVRRIIR